MHIFSFNYINIVAHCCNDYVGSASGCRRKSSQIQDSTAVNVFYPNHVFGVCEARHFRFCVQTYSENYSCMCNIIPLKGMFLKSCDFFKFWELSDNVSLMVPDRDTVATEY